jgi:hypothetical protein
MTPLSIAHIAPGSPGWVYPLVMTAVALHIGAGCIGILSGWVTVSASKGGPLHRKAGTVFVAAMLVMAVVATGLAIWIHQVENIAAGLLAFYFVATGWMTARRGDARTGLFEKAALLFVSGIALTFILAGLRAAASPHGLDGYPSTLFFIFGGIAVAFAGLDLKVILQGGVSGAQRIARHLWRMCLAFFFASASFFVGQQKVMPVWMHGSKVLLVLGFAPLVVMVFWLLVVRLTKRFKTSATVA